MQGIVTGLVLVCSTLQPSSGAATPKEQYEALIKEYNAADLQWEKDYNVDGGPQAKVDWEMRYRASPIWSFAPRFIRLAEANPDDPIAIDALLWITNQALHRVTIVQELLPLYARAVELLLQGDRIDDPRIGQACVEGLRYDSPPSEKFLRIVMDKSRNRDVRGRACAVLAKLLVSKRSKAQNHWFEEGTKSPLPPLVTKRIDPSYIKYIREADPGALYAEILVLFERAAKDYGDIVYDPSRTGVYRRTIAEVARSELHEFRDLSVGLAAPEIEGESVDGKPLRLSDYRGKVVVLSFWATWCGPCMDMIPHERSLVKRLEGRPFALLGIDGDADRQKAKAVMIKEGMNWPSWWDRTDADGPIATQWNVRGWPTIYILDHNGVIRYKSFPRDELDMLVDTLLKEMESKK
jgi:thiol-disulfide isomerase/thioredoxin